MSRSEIEIMEDRQQENSLPGSALHIRSSELSELNAANLSEHSNPGLVQEIWHHVVDNARTVATGNGTVLQDLELVGEVTAVGAATFSASLALAGFAAGGAGLFGSAAADGAVLGAVYGGVAGMIGSSFALVDRRAEFNARKHKD